MPQSILLTGGSGFVGSHTLVELLKLDFNCVVFDSLANSSKECLRRCEEITGKSIVFIEGDLLDYQKVDETFEKNTFVAVIHFAGLKSVGESVSQPLKYYRNNLVGTINLLMAMQKYNVNNLVFSSSATVYGSPKYLPIDENHPVGECSNPYGKTKFFIEHIITDHMVSLKMNYIHLRYFNPIGAHESGKIGENPRGIPNNLVPYVSQVAFGHLPCLNVFGSDYNTPDGTGVRDYVHVVDLAIGHVDAVKLLLNSRSVVHKVYNLGTGKGYSVLEVVKAYEAVSGRKIAYKLVDRRPGDVASVYADTRLAEKELGWKAKFGLDRMCLDSWRWQSNNPKGYDD